MFYYERYRKGYKFKELDYSDIGDAGSSYSLEMIKERNGIEIKQEDFGLTRDEVNDYLQKCEKFKEAFRDFEHKSDNLPFYLYFILLPVVSLGVGLLFYYTSIEVTMFAPANAVKTEATAFQANKNDTKVELCAGKVFLAEKPARNQKAAHGRSGS